MGRFTLSVWDRLLLGESGSAGSAGVRGSLADLKEGVARDLETLLNTRCSPMRSQVQGWPLSQASVWAYGMPDLTGMGLSTPLAREAAGSAIEQAIRCFEPRLQQVRVLGLRQQHERASLAFAVDAWLVLRPWQERVSFDAALHAVTQRYTVRRGAVGAAWAP